MIEYTVRRIDYPTASKYICAHHYSKGCNSNANPCYGLFDGEQLIGALMFAIPCAERVRASVFGVEHKERVTELSRLHILDCTPKNTESWFITRCLQLLIKDKPEIRGVISFADSTEGHAGIVYRATNAWRCGKTQRSWFWMGKDGRLHHPRQGGKKVTQEMADRKGWTRVRRESKNRYIYVLGVNRRDRLWWEKLFRQRFPKATRGNELKKEKNEDDR